MIKTLIEALLDGERPDVLLAIVLSADLRPGDRIAARPSATMATALLVPITFFMSPIAAMAPPSTASAMAIFSGDIPGACFVFPARPRPPPIPTKPMP